MPKRRAAEMMMREVMQQEMERFITLLHRVIENLSFAGYFLFSLLMHFLPIHDRLDLRSPNSSSEDQSFSAILYKLGKNKKEVASQSNITLNRATLHIFLIFC
jgi:hypothetical protein